MHISPSYRAIIFARVWRICRVSRARRSKTLIVFVKGVHTTRVVVSQVLETLETLETLKTPDKTLEPTGYKCNLVTVVDLRSRIGKKL